MSDTPGASRAGSRFGPYELRRLLGRGGMGEVYEAYDTVKDRTVALKLLPVELSHNDTFRKRLEREARSAGKLQEPHVVPIHDYGEVDGHLYVDMRLIDGADLRTVLNRDGPLPPARAAAIVRQIGAALTAAHAAGVTHRDVKPENILVTADDFAYLVDFGIANAATDDTLTEQGSAIGTFAYMAPERFTSAQVTFRADIYALACVLYECLTGSKPYRAESVSVLITAHLMEPVPQPSLMIPGLPAALDAVVARGMAKVPEHRFASAAELGLAATHAAGVTGGAFAAPSPPHPAPPLNTAPVPRRRRSGWVPAGAVAGSALLLTAAATAWSLRTPSSEMSATQTITRTVTSTPRTTVKPPPNEVESPTLRRLLGAVPAGYDFCEPVKPPISGALVTVDCGQNTSPGGPQTASYSLYQTTDALDDAFGSAVDQGTLQDCPGGGENPGTWDYENTPESVEGSMACGLYQDTPEIVWTKYSDLMLGMAQGGELADLHNWWWNYV
jgi:serine/threonine kinase PknH